MNRLNYYIQEKLKVNSKSKVNEYVYHPQNREELIELLKKLIEERGYNADLNDIDTSKIKKMNAIFSNDKVLKKFDGDISKWDVSNVETMFHMFGISEFSGKNGDISNWDVSNVKSMEVMFLAAHNFNLDLSKWNVRKDCNMRAMFYSCPLQKNPPSWYNGDGNED